MKTTTFRIVPLARERFTELFALDDRTLANRGILRRTVPAEGGVPCRVSLEDARPGESVLLLPFVHHDVTTPYRASGPIYVREDARTAELEPGEVPEMLRRRLLSLRAYDARGMLVHSEVVQGADLELALGKAFEDAVVAYVHLHNARPGCFNCAVERVPGA
jgi:hypothetical protein